MINRKIGIIIIVCAVIVLGTTAVIPFSVVNLGFEGAKCHFYGADFRFAPEWHGTYQLHKYEDAEDMLCHHEAHGYWDKIFWGSTATPNDAIIEHEWKTPLSSVNAFPSLGVHVQSNIQLQDINRQGDPLNWNITDPLSGRRVEYWTRNAVKEETEEKVIYHWEVTKETFLLVPAEFWVGFYLVPSQTKTGERASGWREDEWQNVLTWFRLDFNVWDNAYRDPWLQDPEVNVFDSQYEGVVLNRQKTHEYRGGFPIAGWIQGWEKAGYTSDVKAGQQFSPLWYDLKGKVEATYTAGQLSQLRETLMSKCSFSPSLVGQFITLYDSPDPKFTYELSETDFVNDEMAGMIKAPDANMKKTMYFPINIVNFGTYTEGNVWDGWTIYYPSTYFRIRMIYGVYGNFKYLWTEELAKDPVINYPDPIERHGTTVIHAQGIWGKLGSFTWIIIAIIIIVILALIVVTLGFLGIGIGLGRG